MMLFSFCVLYASLQVMQMQHFFLSLRFLIHCWAPSYAQNLLLSLSSVLLSYLSSNQSDILKFFSISSLSDKYVFFTSVFIFLFIFIFLLLYCLFFCRQMFICVKNSFALLYSWQDFYLSSILCNVFVQFLKY